jgi:uncharacterized membrane protein YkvA (DUF1232 family)
MLETLKSIGQRIRREVKVYQLLLKDSRVPRPSKWLLGLAIGYLLSPIDLIPDFIPVLGQIDDLIIVPFLLTLALRFIPNQVIDECREKALNG